MLRSRTGFRDPNDAAHRYRACGAIAPSAERPEPAFFPCFDSSTSRRLAVNVNPELPRDTTILRTYRCRGEWRGGISPPRSLRTGREPLCSSGSHHRATDVKPARQCAKSWGRAFASSFTQRIARVLWPRSLLNFRIAHRTSARLI